MSPIVVQRFVSICFSIAHCRINCAFRPIFPLSYGRGVMKTSKTNSPAEEFFTP